MDRLLTDEERQKLMAEYGNPTKEWSFNAPYLVYDVAKAQRDLTRELTLKEVGEWLAGKRKTSTLIAYIYPAELEALSKGEMPEGKEVR